MVNGSTSGMINDTNNRKGFPNSEKTCRVKENNASGGEPCIGQDIMNVFIYW